jgi:hypothetical protein
VSKILSSERYSLEGLMCAGIVHPELIVGRIFRFPDSTTVHTQTPANST